LKASLLLVAFTFAATSFSEAAERYRLIHGTTSPDKHYALAWGLRGAADLNKQIETDGDVNQEKLENYIVDLRRRKIIGKLATATVWSYRETSQASPQVLEVAWSSSGMVLIDCEGKWGYISLEAFQIEDGEVVASVNFGENLEKTSLLTSSGSFPRPTGGQKTSWPSPSGRSLQWLMMHSP
jgi:hypothetical protein